MTGFKTVAVIVTAEVGFDKQGVEVLKSGIIGERLSFFCRYVPQHVPT
jgi:hypothetical protein